MYLAVRGLLEGNLGKGGRSQGVICHSPTSLADLHIGTIERLLRRLLRWRLVHGRNQHAATRSDLFAQFENSPATGRYDSDLS